MKSNRKHPLPPPCEGTRTVLAVWQQIDSYRLPDSVIRSVVHDARQREDETMRQDAARQIWTQYRIGTAQLIALGCLIPDDLEVGPRARMYRPAPNADHLLTVAIAAPFFPRALTETTGDPSRYFEIQLGRPHSKMAEVIGGDHGA
jgi:hypothetical protein